jgi:hypothetical protein
MTQSDDQSQATRKRPLWVWLIAAFCVVLPPLSALGLVAIHAGWVPSAATQDPYFKTLGAIDLTIGLLLSAAQFGSGVAM